LIKALVPAMAQRGRGAVVNVTSMAQVSTWPGFGTLAGKGRRNAAPQLDAASTR
jgi:NAD(P)-dependent dehydrogenase (short-subunit alcohol dehydrogenase family)